MSYAALISYSRAADARLAAALQKGLQRLAKPWNRLRALRVFRDDDSLSASPGLWDSIRAALDQSEFFILLASPDAAASVWVAREVEYWLANKPAGNLLIAVTAGEIAWVGDGFDPARTTCLPAAALTAFAAEPRWVDLRHLRREEQLTLQAPAFHAAVAELAAPLHHLPKDELIGQDLVEFRRTRRLVRVTIAVLAALTLGATGSAVFAVTQQRAARAQQAVAEQQRAAAVQLQRVATSRALVARAGESAGGDVRGAARLALAGLAVHDDSQNRAGLIRAVAQSDAIATMTGGGKPVTAVVHSADGRLLAVGDDAGAIRLWDLGRDPEHPVPLAEVVTGHEGAILSLGFSPDSRILVSTGRLDGAVMLWDVGTPTKPVRIGSPLNADDDGEILTTAFAPDGRTLATAAFNSAVSFWNIADRAHPVRIGKGPDVPDMSKAAFSPDLRTLEVARFGEPVLLWDISDPARPARIGDPLAVVDEWVIAMTFSRDGRTLAVASGDETVQLWDLRKRSAPARLGPPIAGRVSVAPERCGSPCSFAVAVAFSANGTKLATVRGRRGAVVWDITDRSRPVQIGRSLSAHVNDISAITFAPDSRSVATGSDDGTVIRWDVTGRFEPRSLGPPMTEDGVIDATVTGDGRTLITSGYVSAKVWDIRKPGRPALLSTLAGVPAIAPGGRTAAIADAHGTVTLWDLSDPARPARLGTAAPRSPEGEEADVPPATALSADGRLLAEESPGGAFLLWDVRDPHHPVQLSKTSNSFENGVSALAFSADSRTLAMSDYDRFIYVWDVSDPAHPASSGEPLAGNTGGVQTLAFAPDGTKLASAGKEVALWDLTGPAGPVLAGPVLNVEATRVAFSPDSRTLAAADPLAASLWDLTEPARPIRLGLPMRGYGDLVAFAPDGRTLVTGSDDGSAKLWDVSGPRWPAEHPVERACAIAGQGLTAQEWARATGDLPYQATCARGR